MSAVTSGSSRWPWSAKLSVLAAGAVALGFALHSREVSAPAAAAVGPPRVATPAPTPKPPARLTVQRPARPAAMRAPADTDLREAELLAALSAQPSVAETRRILHGLSRVGTPAALPAIAELAESGPLALRELAIASLGTLGGDEATAVLIGLTESEREPERVAAVQALGRAGTEPAADWLRELASADRSPLAHHAILALGDIGGADVEVELLRHLRDLDETRAVAASQALGVLGSPAASAALLLSARTDTRDPVRASAVMSLAAFPSEEVMVLLRSLAFGTDDAAGNAAVAALGSIGTEESVEALRALAFSGKRQRADQAGYALANVGIPSADAALREILEDGPEWLAWTAAQALVGRPTDENREALLRALDGSGMRLNTILLAMRTMPPDPKLAARIVELVGSSRADVAMAAVAALPGQLGEDALPTLAALLPKARVQTIDGLLSAVSEVKGPKAARLLMDVARTGTPQSRISALQYLATRDAAGREAAKALILEQLESGASGVDRGQSLSILARIGGPEVLTLLTKEAASGGPNARNGALWALAQSEDPAATEALLGLVREAPESRRGELIGVLANRDDPEARAMLGEFAKSDGASGAMALSMLSMHAPEQARAIAMSALESKDPTRRAQALGVLSQTGGDEAFAVAEKALGDEDQQVRAQALGVLASFVDERATQAILKAYREGDDSLRSSATWALSSTGHPEATKMLLESALSGGDEVRYGALSALAQSADKATMDKLLARASVKDDRGAEIRNYLSSMGLMADEEAEDGGPEDEPVFAVPYPD
jgi:HEAT repeat protein